MQANGHVDPEQLAMLAGLLDEHCQASGIQLESPEHEILASRILTLFTGGMTAIDDLKQALTSTRDTA
ncbi:hypothetical protein [Mesorhizobium sp. SARCC-RB16n]|uniref:hypothetical protein n=1 Tax=Mesorhizobium sp. SARCC-RB16n TaxID=2116687 RepID=UPI00122EF4ED|nr:hypothetical protein [Mesorhizobium sp. SARCC-RB16n]